MNTTTDDVWQGRSVLFKSFWGWSPETWGALGWSSEGRRDTICQSMTDPFILVCNVTRSAPDAEEHELGRIVGFYLISHEKGDRDEFTHPIHHALEPTKWRYALRAIRAFTYLPEYRLQTRQFDPAFAGPMAQAVGTHGVIIEDAPGLTLLREIPWEEVPVYQPRGGSAAGSETAVTGTPLKGWVSAGPDNPGGYFVPPITQGLPRHLYILRLDGPADALLGSPAGGQRIIKIGLAASPESRRAQFQAAMPRGAFLWRIHRTTWAPDGAPRWAFGAAVAGEYAMKQYLAGCARHLDGEFYLASDEQIDEAWRQGIAAANALSGENA